MFSRAIRSTCVAACLVAAAHAQSPLQDLGFSPATPFPDPDLVVVRERSYGAGGIDLSSYGIGTGLETYVQSLYFRVRTGSGSKDAAVNGLVVFPEGVEILGFVTDSFALGGELNDGVASETDGIFGIAADPDDYSAQGRGLDSADQVCLLSPNTFLFLMGVGSGVDDFRVIVDYGEFFTGDVAFDLFMAGPGAFRGVAPSPGLRIGDDLLPAVLGSGDFGEVTALAAIPLTSDDAPHAPLAGPTEPADSVYIVRDTDGQSGVDAYDFADATVWPVAFRFDPPGAPVGMSTGADGFLYSVGVGGSVVFMDVVSGNRVSHDIPNLAGSNVDLTDLAGTRDLFVVRDTSGDTMVDRLDLGTLTFTDHYAIPSTTIGTPVGITDGNDGMLYVLSRGGELVRIDPMSRELTSFAVGQPDGVYVALTRDPSNLNLYLLRKTGEFAAVDRHISDCAVIDFGIATLIGMTSPVDITYGPDDLLYVVGEEGSASPLASVDPVTGGVMDLVGCVNFIGFARGIAYTSGSFGEIYCEPAAPNSSGAPAWISVHGSDVAGGVMEAAAWSLPSNQFGYFLTSMNEGYYPHPGGSQGTLCLDNPIGRFNAQVQNTGALGRLRIAIDTNAMPLTPLQAVMAGEQWSFQAWYRDENPGTTSNFTSAIRVLFE